MIEDTIAKWGGVAVFVFMVSNGVISTPPSELVLSFAGSLTINRDMYFFIMLVGVVLCNYIGTAILYLLGRYKGKMWYDKIRGKKIFCKLRFVDQIIPTSDRLIKFFNNQEWLIFACRFLPFIRSIISVPAGIAKMNFLKFTIYSLIGITIWSFAWLWAGRTMISKAMNGNTYMVFILIILFIISGIFGKIIQKSINNHKEKNNE